MFPLPKVMVWSQLLQNAVWEAPFLFDEDLKYVANEQYNGLSPYPNFVALWRAHCRIHGMLLVVVVVVVGTQVTIVVR